MKIIKFDEYNIIKENNYNTILENDFPRDRVLQMYNNDKELWDGLESKEEIIDMIIETISEQYDNISLEEIEKYVKSILK